MNIHIKKQEKGQIVVILVLAFVGILGFVAIAVDGGMIFSDRRYDQNAADASALAGAGVAAQYLENEEINWTNFDCGSSTVHAAEDLAVAKAQERATANNFTIDSTLANQHGVVVNCVDNEWTGSYNEKYLEVHGKYRSWYRQMSTPVLPTSFTTDASATRSKLSPASVRAHRRPLGMQLLP